MRIQSCCWAGVSRHTGLWTGLHLAPERIEVEREQTAKTQVSCFEEGLGTGSLKVGKIWMLSAV